MTERYVQLDANLLTAIRRAIPTGTAVYTLGSNPQPCCLRILSE